MHVIVLPSGKVVRADLITTFLPYENRTRSCCVIRTVDIQFVSGSTVLYGNDAEEFVKKYREWCGDRSIEWELAQL